MPDLRDIIASKGPSPEDAALRDSLSILSKSEEQHIKRLEASGRRRPVYSSSASPANQSMGVPASVPRSSATPTLLGSTNMAPPASEEVAEPVFKDSTQFETVKRQATAPPLNAMAPAVQDKLVAGLNTGPALTDGAKPMISKGLSLQQPRSGRSYEEKVVAIESGGNPKAKNPNSSAFGLHQFTAGTWMGVANKYFPEYENLSKKALLDLRADPEVSSKFFGKLTEENREALERNNIQPTDAALYAAHFFGPSDVIKLYQAKDTELASAVFSKNVINSNPMLKGKTIGDVKNWIQGKLKD